MVDTQAADRKSKHLLLAAIDSGAVAGEIIRSTQRLADSLDCSWIALYVERPGAPSEVEHVQIARALALAQELGAEVITTTGTDLVRSVLRVARQRNATQIIIGKPRAPFWRFFGRDGEVRRLIRNSGEADVHVVCSRQAGEGSPFRGWQIFGESSWCQYLIAVGVVIAITVVAFMFGPMIGGPHAAALIYLLAVVGLGSFVRLGPTLLAATMSALLWDYFILPPVNAFHIQHVEDALFFGLYFMVALILGQLTTRIRAQQEAEHLREERATALYLLTRELNDAATLDLILNRAIPQMERAFNAPIAVLSPDAAGQPKPHPTSTYQLAPEDERAAAWVLKQGQRAGRFTGNFSQAEALYVPLTTSDGTLGVIGLRLGQSVPPTINQLNMMDAFCQQIAFALDRQRLREISEKTKLLAESERLSKTLLNSMSHEMRLPIAVIKSAVSNFVQLQPTDQSEPHQAIIVAIQDATERLNRLVGNVLDITRLETGHIKPRSNPCDVSDLIHTAISVTEKELARHTVTVEIARGLPIVPMDFVLMEQALTNLLSNAAIHTAPGTAVLVTARAEGEFLVIEVGDRGAGIPPESLERIFEKFFRGPAAPTGGTGLGLSLVRGLVEAQAGHVTAENRIGGGALFTIRLPLGNVPPVSVETGL